MGTSYVRPSRSSRSLSALIRLACCATLLALSAGMLVGVARGGDLGRVQAVSLPMEVPDVVSRSADLGACDPERVLHIAVSLSYADPEGMQEFVDSVSDPTSPGYRHFITPDEVGDTFGLPDEQVQSVVDYLASAGFQINLVGKNHLSILVEGTVAQAEAAFNTEIHEFQALSADEPGNTDYFSYTAVPTLPPSIADYVIDVTGLESFTKPQHRSLTPTKTRTLYGVAPMYSAGTQGQGRTVAISNWDGYRLTNVPLYYSHYSLPTPSGGVGSNITVITISGGAGSGSPYGEGDLDIQMPLGMAPLCDLRIYDGGNSDLIGVLTAEANDNLADTISESYGWYIGTSTANAAHNLHLSMSAQGITYMCASGDDGTNLEPYSYPDYDPEVLMVGGSVATTNSSGVRTSEVTWSGSGGGWSTKSISFNTLPSWQQGTNVPTNIDKRLVPDVALHSSSSSGAYYFYYNGSLTGDYVGTSFASPVFAGALAVAEQQIISQGGLPPDGSGHQRFGRIQDLFYSQNGRSDVWYDITSGSNGTLPNGSSSNAGTAWDFCTGWGAIDFNAFVATQACALDTTDPTSQTVCAGDPASFSVTASGTGPYTYQWRKNGSNIGGATGSTYTIASTVSGDAGSYDCVVGGDCSEVTSGAATLTVNAAASIIGQPSNQTACAGDSVSFTVTASGTAPLSYQWRKNGSNIGGATSSTYNIGSVSTSNAGSYDCVVTNSCGNATSNAATLTVNTAASITGQPSNQTVCAGDSASFSVTASGTAPLSYQWRKNGSNIGGATSSTYNIGSVSTSNAGSYDCMVTNGCGDSTSNTATLTVNTAPSIIGQPSNQTACAGDSASFSVTASGTAPFSYQWRKNSSNIGGATSSTYNIGSVSTGDVGSYDCVVTNGCGDTTSNTATLTVNTGPSITGQPQSVVAHTGETVLFGVTAADATSYQWRLDGGNISGATGASYSIASVAQVDAGTYDCLVTNDCGTIASDAADLTVWLTGDMNCDGVVNLFDIDPFVLAVTNANEVPPFASYYAAYPNCNAMNGDIDGSGDVNLFDIDPFVGLVTGP